jgi:nicotinamide mononucleotide adenylyltransferase
MTTSDPDRKTATTSASSSESIGGGNSRGYTFPQAKLRRKLLRANKTPLVLVACGSFSPITVLHLQLFELAARYAEESTEFEIVGNYLSPCSDTYGKTDLAPSQHRIAM